MIVFLKVHWRWTKVYTRRVSTESNWNYMMTIGNTPLIKLERLSEPGCAEIYVKYEGANPTGSMKDRMALAMIEEADQHGNGLFNQVLAY